MIARVLIDNLGAVGDKVYDYKIPENLIKDVEIGKRILVYFGRGQNLIPALVIDIKEQSEYEDNKLKNIVEVLDEEIIVRQYLIDLIKYMRDNYFCTYIDALRCVLPSLEQVKRKETYELINEEKKFDKKYDSIISLIKKRNGDASFDYLKSKLGLNKENLKEEISYLVKKEIILKHVSYYIQEEKKQEVVSLSGKYETIEDYLKNIRANAIKQISVIKALEKGELYYEKLINITGANRGIVTKLSDMGLIKTYFIDKDDEFDLSLKEEHKDVILNEEQNGVLNSYFDEKNTNKFLLHGVTGSGKTEVYIKMFKDQINKGKQCLFLVPRNCSYSSNDEKYIL